MLHDGENLLFYLLHLSVKLRLQRKFNKNIQILKYQFLIQQEFQDLTRLTVSTIILFQRKFKTYRSKSIL